MVRMTLSCIRKTIGSLEVFARLVCVIKLRHLASDQISEAAGPGSPRQACKVARDIADQQHRGGVTIPNSKLLLVEDSKFLRLSNERVLTKAGYEVSTAADGEEALRIAGEQ